MRDSIIAMLFLSLTAFLINCARNPIVSEFDIIEYPSLNLPQRAASGETIFEKSQLYSYDELELLAPTDCHFVGMTVMTILPGKLQEQFEDDNGVYFYTDKFKNGPSSYYTHAGIFIPKNNTSGHFAFAVKDSPDSLVILSCDTLNFQKTKKYDHSKPSFKQELIYNGRHDDTIKFVYRELTSEFLRNVFSQDIQFDLSESKIIEFKGVKIEIIEASDNYLEYKVLSSFVE